MEKALQELVGLVNSRQHALELMFTGLVIALAENKRLPVKKAISAMEFMTAFAYLTASPQVAGDCLPTLERLRAALVFEGQPRKPFETRCLLSLDAGPEKRDALRTWLAQASGQEIAEDVLEILRKLRQQGKPEA